MRMANKAIQRERHPTPTVDDLIHAMNGAKIFSKLDLRAGYHQLTLAEESRYITTFATHKGLRRYRKLNFGTSSASEIFQQAIHDQIRDIPNVINMSDDVIVYGKTQAEHDSTLRAVFQRFSERGLTLNKEKCKFNQDKLTFFGFVFSSAGISPDPVKVEAIHNAPPPTTAKDVRSFLGLATYCSKFIRNFSDLTQPLRDLTKKHATFRWTSQHAKSFQAVKSALESSTVMAYFDQNKETELVTDASPTGLSAILSQKSADQDDRKIVSYISRSLTDVEKKYSQTEREALAIVWAIERLNLYLYGARFTLMTDCKPVEMILNNPMSRPPARIERWNLRLQDYDFDIQYIKGLDNPSDFLSRHHPTSTNVHTDEFAAVSAKYLNFLVSHAVPKAMTLSQIQDATKSDKTLQHLTHVIQTNQWNFINKHDHDPEISKAEIQAFSKIRDELSIAEDSGIILRGSRIVLPNSLRQKAIEIAHEGHQGVVKTKRLLREKVWFPGIDNLVQQNIETCIPCQATGSKSKPEPLEMTDLPPEVWHTVNIDFCGPFPGGEYLLVVIDAYSRFPEVEIVSSTSSKVTIPKLERIFATHGLPQFVKSDNGPPFPGHEFYQFMKELGATHKPSSPLWPQGNAEVERFMQPLEKAIRTANLEGQDWKRAIFKFLLNYRATPHSTTGHSPATLLFNRNIRTKLPHPVKENKSNMHQKLKEKDSKAKAKMKDHADEKSRAKTSAIVVGDIVLVRQSKENKLSTRYDPKPYKVVKRRGSRITVLRNGHYVTRNISFFKKLTGKVDDEIDSATETDYFDHDIDNGVSNEGENNARYPVRNRQPVQRYGQNIYS